MAAPLARASQKTRRDAGGNDGYARPQAGAEDLSCTRNVCTRPAWKGTAMKGKAAQPRAPPETGRGAGRSWMRVTKTQTGKERCMMAAHRALGLKVAILMVAMLVALGAGKVTREC